MKNNNAELVRFCIDKVGTAYVMGTNGKIFTQAMYNDLVKRNPGGWFTAKRLPMVKTWIGKVTTDCHGLVEWFVRESTGEAYDVTADRAFAAAKVKGNMDTLPEVPGICVRYKGHIGVYIGGGYVVEARGFSYGTSISKLSQRPWTDWYEHPKIAYTKKTIPAPKPAKVSTKTDRYSVVWLQTALNHLIARGKLAEQLLTVDGIYGKRTALVCAAYWQKKGWTKEAEVWGVGKNTVKALQKEAV